MNIPLSHIRKYISHNIVCIRSSGSRLPLKVVSRHVCTADKTQTAASQWGAHHCLHSHPKRADLFLCMQRSITKVLHKYFKSIAAEPDTFPFLSRCKPHTSWRSQGWRFPKVHRLGFLRFSPAPCSRWHGEWVGWQSIAIVLQSVTKYWPVWYC